MFRPESAWLGQCAGDLTTEVYEVYAMTPIRKICALSLLLGLLAACGGNNDSETVYPDDDYVLGRGGQGSTFYDKERGEQGLFGSDGITLLGGNSESGAPGAGGGLGVNSYLWRASLDTVSFMPLNSADPFGGVIITEWYTPPDSPNERFKINIVILGRDLRADGVRANVFRQQLTQTGTWVDQTVSPETNTELENAILTRARQLRITQLRG